MCRRISWSASALVISSRESWPVSTGSSPLMPCAASPSAMAFTSRGCSLQKSAIWSNDSAVFSTSQTAVAFGISGIAMANLLCASPALRAKPVVISDDGYAPNIGISPPPVHRFRGLLDRPAWRAPPSGTSSVCKLEHARKGRAMAVYTDVSAEDLAGADFPMRRRNALSVEGWRPLCVAAAAGADTVQPGLRDMIERELTMLETAWPSDLPEGVIHADLFPDNVFFLGDRLSGLIDFYFACTDTLAYDVAICLNAWCFEPDRSYNITKGRALLRSYMRARQLTAREIAVLPTLCRGAALRFLLTRLVDWLEVPPGALVRPKDPLEYYRKLRFHQTDVSARDYGID